MDPASSLTWAPESVVSRGIAAHRRYALGQVTTSHSFPPPLLIIAIAYLLQLHLFSPPNPYPRRHVSPSIMALPYELVDLIFSHVDSPADMKSLRLACYAYSRIGLPHIFSPHFKCLPWRNDVWRLWHISAHPHLRHLIKTVTFNLSDLDEDDARRSCFFDHWATEPEDRDMVLLQSAWVEFHVNKASRIATPKLESQGKLLAATLGDLPCLESVKIAYNECPYEGRVLARTFERLEARKLVIPQATRTFEVLGRALSRCRNLRSVTIDRFPVAMAWTSEPALKELLPWTQTQRAENNNNWAAFARSLDRRLARLTISLDCTSSTRVLPAAARFCDDAVRAAAALVTCSAASLTHLAITKHSYDEADLDSDNTANDLLNNPLFRTYYPRLADLELQGFVVGCDELLAFLGEHAATLRRLSLGGQGPTDAGGDSASISEAGLTLRFGTWREFFTGLRGLLPNLESLRFRGFFTQSQPSSTGVGGPGGGGFSGETYYLTPLGDFADDLVGELEGLEWGFNVPLVRILDGAVFERFVLEGACLQREARELAVLECQFRDNLLSRPHSMRKTTVSQAENCLARIIAVGTRSMHHTSNYPTTACEQKRVGVLGIKFHITPQEIPTEQPLSVCLDHRVGRSVRVLSYRAANCFGRLQAREDAGWNSI
ncbi:hypothetical protein SODALDRAFT_359701 [Sodiomyces alkalinus F11]|uniref:F-box domain-containing protein n=1 Tax=Sodiomyces alkalinus (strain CBS 110278 / VKM F-3762 / F11) TaxID=1314773 RepID=A0A3N2PVR4_SODAK|nr:hypothetical protein SODALDRAFT_359701 [Sodiomyces alkalinus F11]ROT38600.1 hypothetical protein SODALDRAFT_359701 [Sodiomyces alkalinus F11]